MSSPTATRSESAVVLVIDPNPESQRAIRDRLTAIGYAARSVDDYESAIQVITITPPDVVLTAGQIAQGEAWNDLQAQLNRWGIPLLDIGRPAEENGASTSPLPGNATKVRTGALKL